MEATVLSRPHRLKYDVFFSFRDEDTPHSFAERLYGALKDKVRVFHDNNVGMERKTKIAAMSDSSASVVVLSSRYAESRWCLDELAMLCDLGSSLDRPILPIFYKVDPSHVRKQKDHFENDFKEHEKRFSKEEIQRWKDAMKLVGNLAGYVYGYDSISPLFFFFLISRGSGSKPVIFLHPKPYHIILVSSKPT